MTYRLTAKAAAPRKKLEAMRLGRERRTPRLLNFGTNCSYGLVYYVASDNKVKCSLCSNGDYDVSAIAKAFDGGGHRNAAGFQTDIETLMGWLA